MQTEQLQISNLKIYNGLFKKSAEIKKKESIIIMIIYNPIQYKCKVCSKVHILRYFPWKKYRSTNTTKELKTRATCKTSTSSCKILFWWKKMKESSIICITSRSIFNFFYPILSHSYKTLYWTRIYNATKYLQQQKLKPSIIKISKTFESYQVIQVIRDTIWQIQSVNKKCYCTFCRSHSTCNEFVI